MKKRTKLILISIASIVVLLITFCVIDYYRAMNEKKPIFVIRSVNIFKETKKTATEYYGLGYKITEYYYEDEELYSSSVKYAEYQFLFFKKSWNKTVRFADKGLIFQ